ncbi:MAG: DUF1189 family protein [Verrucomicrobiae bacterium]|nr:DUF1189 family protein [Verrucomicrobiae bacterium]
MAFLRYLWLSCGGFRTYAAFLRLPARSAILYWCGFSGFVAAALAFNAWRWFGEAWPRLLDEQLPDIPTFTIAGGVAQTEAPTPLFANTNHFPILVDPRGEVKDPEKLFASGALVKSRELVVWIPGARPMASAWRHWPEGTMGRAYLDELGRTARESCLVLMPLAWAVVAALGLMQALGFATLGSFFERKMTPSMEFRHLFNIATFALTPGTLILAVYATIGFREVSFPLVYFGSYGLFLVLGSSACRDALSGGPAIKDPDNEEQ